MQTSHTQQSNLYQPDHQIAQSVVYSLSSTQNCSICGTLLYCQNVQQVQNSYFWCTQCTQIMSIEKNYSTLITKINGLSRRLPKNKFSELEASISEIDNKYNSSLQNVQSYFENHFMHISRKNEFTNRTRKLQDLIFNDKLNKDTLSLKEDRRKFFAFIDSTLMTNKSTKSKIKKIGESVKSLIEDSLDLKSAGDMINELEYMRDSIISMKDTNDQILPTMQEQTNYIHSTYATLDERLSELEVHINKLNSDMDETRPKSKDYKELRYLRYTLTMKDGEYTKFKKSMNNFNSKVNILYLIIGINTMTILGLLIYILL